LQYRRAQRGLSVCLPWGDKHEHDGDGNGDVFSADRPMCVHAVSRAAMWQWGQPMPASFRRPKLSVSAIAAMYATCAAVRISLSAS
jgi:hypothetical protein